MGAVLFFPLIFSMGDRLEQHLVNTPFAMTMQNDNIQKLIVAGAAMLFPSFISDVLNLSRYGDINMWLRTFFSSNLIITLLLLVTSNQFTYPLTCLYCSLLYLSWLFIIIPFLMCVFSLQKYHLLHIVIFMMSVYLFCLFDLLNLFYDNHYIYETFQASRIIIAVVLLSSYSCTLILSILPWMKSTMSFKNWFQSLEENLQQGFSFTLIVFVSTALIMLLRYLLCHGDDIRNFNLQYLIITFALITIICCFSVFIPQRQLKLKQDQLLSDLEQKRQFVRYMSHELR